MADLATLYIKVDSQGVVTASRDLNKLTDDSKKTETATEGVTSGFNKLKAVVVALAASYAALKLAQYIKEATMLAARYETLGVVMRVVGNNAGYTGAQMEVYARGLQKAGIAMVESRNTLARMIQAQIDLTNSQKLARIAQDAAVIGNMNSSQSFEQMIYGIQTGMPRILRTIGLNVDFEASVQALALSLNKKTDALSEAEIMQARVNAVVKAGVLIEGTYTAAMETAGKQVLSLTRHLDNLKVLLGAAFTPALAEIISTITKDIESLNGELSGPGAEAIKDWGNNFRLIIMSIEAEIMRLAMFIDKIGGTLTSIGMLLTGPGALIGKIPGLDFAAIPFEKMADINIMLEGRYKDTDKALEALAIRYNKLVEAMTPAGKLAAKQAEDALEAVRLKATADAKANKAAEAATKEQLKIQEDFQKAYKKSVMTIEEFELDSLKTQVDAFRKAKVDETKLEEWMQNELKNIKLRALNEALALYEELAASDSFYAQKAIDTMSVILDAEEKKWAAILQSDDDAHTLRIKRELEYRDKVLGVIDDIVDANVSAARQIVGVGASPGAAAASAGGDVSRGTTGKEFQMTWASYIGPLTDAVVAQLNRNQKAIEDAPKIAQAAAEAAVALQKATDDAQRAAEEARRAAEAEMQRIQDIADTRVELEIQILEATGYATEALGIRRMQELAAMDESLRPLQQRLYYLEDEARAADEAAAATEKLIAAQDASLRTFESSITALVSQGRAIKDFINSLGVTGVSMTLSAARAAYMADLAGARAGDPASYGRITQSAGAFISTAGQTAGSAVEMARIVAGIKRELSALQPVVDLESNIELLKAIKKATSETATSVDRLDVLGIKAIFDLTQVMHFIEDSTGLSPAFRELMVNQTADYIIFLKAQLASDVSEPIKRVLIAGAGIYEANVRASLGMIDAASQKLVIDAQGVYISTVKAAMGFSDPGAVKLALETSNDLLAKVTAAVATGDPGAIKLATDNINQMQAVVTAALAQDATTQQLADMLKNIGLTTTIDGTMTWNPNDPLKAIWEAIKASTDLTAKNTGRYTVYSEPNYYTGRWSIYSGAGSLLTAADFTYWAGMTAMEKIALQAASRPSFQEGGIATGPESGYTATLHGTELVVSPSASYPVTIKGGDMGSGQIDELKRIRQSIEAGNIASVRNSNKIAKILARFDDDGMPSERAIN